MVSFIVYILSFESSSLAPQKNKCVHVCSTGNSQGSVSGLMAFQDISFSESSSRWFDSLCLFVYNISSVGFSDQLYATFMNV